MALWISGDTAVLPAICTRPGMLVAAMVGVDIAISLRSMLSSLPMPMMTTF